MILECQECNAAVNAEGVGHYEAGDRETPVEYRYSFLKCPRCASPFLVIRDRLLDIHPRGWSDPILLFPSQRQADPSLPKLVREPFQEALTCLRNQTFTAAAMLCRKTLEAICVQHEIRSGDLKSKLRKLLASDIIDQRLFEWSDALRISGNEAAHNVNVTVDRQEAQDVVDFTHALLEYVFTYRDKFAKFMQRREQQAQLNAKFTKPAASQPATAKPAGTKPA